MDRVQVKTNPNSNVTTTIDLSNDPWKELHQNNLPPFKMEEILRPCDSYPEGIFPGAEKYGPDKQISRILRFPNYIEFCRVVKEDTYSLGGENYLTDRFYEMRKKGWNSETLMTKPGKTIGYSLNGDVYNLEQRDKVYDIYYGLVYYTLVKKMPSFLQLQTMLKEGIILELVGADHDFLVQLSTVLLQSIKV